MSGGYERTLAVKEAAEARLRTLPGVHAVGVGWKSVRGEPTQELCIVVFLERKRPLERLLPHQVVPAVIDGVRTDVVEMAMPRQVAADPANLNGKVADPVDDERYFKDHVRAAACQGAGTPLPAPCPRGRGSRHLNVLDTKLVGAHETVPSRRDPGENHAQAAQEHHAAQGDASPARASEPARCSRRHGHRRHLCSQRMPGELHEHLLPLGVPDLLQSLLLASTPARPAYSSWC
jgi:hypothetical protein